MELATVVTAAVPAQTVKQLTSVVTLVPGDPLKIELGTEHELDVVCPPGKVWLATVHVHVVETDA